MYDISCSALSPLPTGARLLHIGPHKTGTTALQSALDEARPQLARHGVFYPPGTQSYLAARGVMQSATSAEGTPVPMRHWRQLVRQVESADSGRTIVSSEFLCEADQSAIERVAHDLGRDQVHVVVTLRPLAELLPSSWQQFVRNRAREPYDAWLRRLFGSPAAPGTTSLFWLRHAHDRLVARWVRTVGADRLTVVVPGAHDRRFVARTVEELTDLPDGLLQPRHGHDNRSLTHGEVELMRRINVALHPSRLSPDDYRRIVRDTLTTSLQTRTPGVDEPRIATPDWALDLAAQHGSRAADSIVAQGVRVVGDIARLGSPHSPIPPTSEPTLPSHATADALAAALVEAVDGTAAPARSGSELGGRELVRLLRTKARRRAARSVRRFVASRRPSSG